MSSELKELEARALRLSADERERLASQLFRSLNEEAMTETESAWLEVAEKRFQALKDGTDSGLSESEFFAALS